MSFLARRTLGPTHSVLAVLCLSVASTSPANAQTRQRNPGAGRGASRPTPPAPASGGLDDSAPQDLVDVAVVFPKLNSANPDEVRAAIDQLAVVDHPEVVPRLVALLNAGQPDAITDRALEALGGIAQASAIDVLAEFTRHRRVEARRIAYRALAGIRDPRVPAVIERGLRDSDPVIRGSVATALGELGARASVDTLFRALERGVPEAATSIGKLGNGEAIERFNSFLGRQRITDMLSGYAQFLRRTDIQERPKLDIIAKLGEVSTPAVRRTLTEYLATFPNNRTRNRNPIVRALEETISRIPLEAIPVRGGAR